MNPLIRQPLTKFAHPKRSERQPRNVAPFWITKAHLSPVIALFRQLIILKTVFMTFVYFSKTTWNTLKQCANSTTHTLKSAPTLESQEWNGVRKLRRVK